MRRPLVLAVLANAVLAGCHPLDNCPSLEKLRQADPVSDAKTASFRGDNYLLMLGGYVGTIPGVEGSGLPAKLIEGTTDYETEACRRLRPLVEAYAAKYNATMVAAQTPTNRTNSN
jgi:hypothetical protein